MTQLREQAAYLNLAITAARAAGRIHREHAGRALQISSKSSFSDLVTEVDGLAETEIRSILLGAHPDHGFLGEEGGETAGAGAEYRWVVDPLDGTVNYAHGFPVSCVSIALEVRGEREVGAVYDPNRDELFTATRGGGAFLNGSPISVSQTPELRTPALISTGFPYDPGDSRHEGPLSRLLAVGVPLRRPGAAALDLCNVACGRMDGYWEIGLKRWDAAAGSLIAEEAGGRVTNGVGEATPYGEMIVATNGALHDELLRVLGG